MTSKSDAQGKPKLWKVRSVSDFRLWWNTVVDVKVKAIVFTALVQLFILGGFQYQVQALNSARLDDLCVQRIEARENLRETLYAIVDLDELFPGDPVATEYKSSREAIIEETQPVLTEEDCV